MTGCKLHKALVENNYNIKIIIINTLSPSMFLISNAYTILLRLFLRICTKIAKICSHKYKLAKFTHNYFIT